MAPLRWPMTSTPCAPPYAWIASTCGATPTARTSCPSTPRGTRRTSAPWFSAAYPIDFDPWGRDRLSAARRGIRLVCARTHRCQGDAVLRDLAALATRLRERPVSFTVAVGSRRFRARLNENAVAELTFSGGSAFRLGVIPATVASGASGDLAPLRRLAETALLMSAYPVTQHQSTTDGFAQAFATECHDFPRAYSLADTAAAPRGASQRAAAALGPRGFLPFSASAWTSAGFSE